MTATVSRTTSPSIARADKPLVVSNQSVCAYAYAGVSLALGDDGRPLSLELAMIILVCSLWRSGTRRRRSAQRPVVGALGRSQPKCQRPDALRSALPLVILTGDLSGAILVLRELQRSGSADEVAFALVIDACSARGDLALADQLLEDLLATCAKPSRAAFHTIMRAYGRRQDMEGVRWTYDRMRQIGHAHDRGSHMIMMRASYCAGNYDDMCASCDQVIEHGWHLDATCLALVMHAAGRTKDPQAGRKVLSILDASGIDVCGSVRALHGVLSACMRWRDAKHLDLALREFQLREHGLPATRYTYFLAIRGNAALGRTDDAKSVWESMLRRGLLPTSLLVSCMINALMADCHIEEALDLFRAWRGTVRCDDVVYTALLKGVANRRDPDGALALFEDMKAAGVKVTSATYATVISACTHDQTMDRAEAVFKGMLQGDCTPTVSIYAALICGHCRVGGMLEALELLRQMRDSGLAADIVVYNILLDGCIEHQFWELAMEVLREMDDHGVRRTSFTISILVKLWSRRKQLERAVEVVREAVASGEARVDPSCGRTNRHRPGSIDPRVASSLIGACLHNRRHRRALELFREMKAWPDFDGPEPHTYSALITGLSKQGYVGEAVEIAEEACATMRSEYAKAAVSDHALQTLLTALIDSGKAAQIGGPLAVKLRAAGMPRFGSWLRQWVEHATFSIA